MEDYSGGWLAASITDSPESLRFFKGGLVACSDEAKVAFGVDAELLLQYGAVSPEVAQAMAQAVRVLLRADVGISVTGVKETEARPVGVVYIGIADDRSSRVIINNIRIQGKQRVAATTLFELRKSLLSP